MVNEKPDGHVSAALQLRMCHLVGGGLVFVFFLSGAFSAVRRVPEEYATIQAALDALEELDTVLVDTGIYAEALVAPPVSFTLLGNTAPDTGSYPRPVVDPTDLPGSDTLKCLDLPGGDSVIVRDFVFRNGAAMSRPGFTVGGIRNQAASFIASRCVWDSVYVAVHSVGHPVLLQQCVFTECFQFCVHAGSAAIYASEVVFQGHSEWSLLQCGSQSTFTRCSISNGPADAHLVIVTGTSVSFTDCVIGPSDGGPNFPIQANLSNSRFENNLFTGNVIGNALVLLNVPCDSAVGFRNNVFLHNQTTALPPGLMTIMLEVIASDTFSQCKALLAEGNVFASSECNAIYCNGRDSVLYNRFRDLSGRGPSVKTHYRSIHIRQSTFDGTGMAAEAEYPGTIDAEWNWWGHESGPYHEFDNPAGQGDTIVGNVLFDPWYPDTNFLSVPGIGKPLPEQFVFDAYPNPFNNTVTLRLIPSEVMIVRVELFDILGRRVKEIWSGPLAFEKQITFDGQDLASGIYFARVWQPIGNRPLALTKLVLMK